MNEQSQQDRATKNVLEWTVFGISSTLVISVFVTLLIWAVSTEEGEPQLKVEMAKPQLNGEWLQVPVTVSNHGSGVAANVEIRVRCGEGDQAKEAGFTVDFIPRGGFRKGSVAFHGMTLADQVRCDVVGYEVP